MRARSSPSSPLKNTRRVSATNSNDCHFGAKDKMLSSRKCIAALLLLLLHIALPPGAAAFNQWMYLPQTPQDARGLDCNPRPTQAKSTSQQPVMGPWFPMRKADLDCFGKTLDAGVEIDADHPGFRDVEYRERRARITENALTFRHGDVLPSVDYTPAETNTYNHIYGLLRDVSRRHAISSYNDIMDDLEREGIFSGCSIPQLSELSSYLHGKTGFTLRPVAGLMTPRHFLNGLAFKVFHSTQYVRHHSKPLYTPEPDVIHEFCGHVPMFADPAFAALSHKIGLASLAASNFEIKRLATAYWFSVEFGLCRERGELKAYGAGLLSSVGELEYACGGGREGPPAYREFDPVAASLQDYPITHFQPLYYVADSLTDAEAKIAKFGETLSSRPFSVDYDAANDEIITSRPVLRGVVPGMMP